MAPKRRREGTNDDEDQENITWISQRLYTDLNDKRQSGREHLNKRLDAYGLKSRPTRSIPRPRGEAGRKSVNSKGGHRNGFTLKAILKHESNVDAEHYTMIQDTVHRLAARYLDVRRTWRENQGDDLVTVCIEAAKLHPCLYDYDGFWPVHDHLKRHLVSTRDKYSYLDPDLVALYDAEAAARGEVRPPPRKKRRTVSKNDQCSAPRSPSPSTSAPNDLIIDVDQLSEPELLPHDPSQLTMRHNLDHHTDSQVHQAAIHQFLLQIEPVFVQRPEQRQKPHGRFAIEMGNPQADTSEFLMALYDKLVKEGHRLRRDIPIRSQIWKILLGVNTVDPDVYNRYVNKGPSPESKILRIWTERYYDGGQLDNFFSNGTNRPLIRLVDALFWRWEEAKYGELSSPELLICALVILYTMSNEAEAFYCLENFLVRYPTLASHSEWRIDRRIALVGQCLERLDGDLHKYLQSNGYSTRDYARLSIIGLSAFGQPPEQVVKLWDLFLSDGLHLNVLTAVSRICLGRDIIMSGKDPKKILNDSLILDAEPVVRYTLELEQRLQSDLLDRLKENLSVPVGTLLGWL